MSHDCAPADPATFPTRRSSDLHRRTLWSDAEARAALGDLIPTCDLVFAGPEEAALVLGLDPAPVDADGGADLAARLAKLRSEEPTSELQSQFHLVCRPPPGKTN